MEKRKFAPFESDLKEAYEEGLNYITDITHRNYLATVRRGLITEETGMWEFIDKIREEIDEFNANWGDWSELADITLVCFAMAEHYGIDLIDEMRKKTEFNEKRP